jgi:phytoene synthase
MHQTPPSPAQALIAEGSNLHYALRRAPPSARPALTWLHALCRTIWNVTREVSDPGVAAAKLAWWAGELSKTEQGEATHPLTRALAAESGGAPDVSALQAFVQGCELDLRQSRLLDEAALLQHARLVGGAPWSAAAALLGLDETQAQALHAAGTALRLADIVSRLGLDLREGRVYIPIDELQRFGVKAGELQAGPALQAESRFHELMAHEVRRARERIEAASGPLRGRGIDPRLSRPARALCALALATLQEVEDEHYALLDRRLMLTPLRKVWIAWRAG